MGEAGKIISDTFQFVIIKLDKQPFALDLAAVERTVRAVAVTPLPNAPFQVLGMVNVGGSIMPVVSMRRLYGLPEHELDVDDQFVIMRDEQLSIALVVDEVAGVSSCNRHEVVNASTFLPGLDGLRVIVRQSGEIIILHEPGLLPNMEAMQQLEAAIRGTS